VRVVVGATRLPWMLEELVDESVTDERADEKVEGVGDDGIGGSVGDVSRGGSGEGAAGGALARQLLVDELLKILEDASRLPCRSRCNQTLT